MVVAIMVRPVLKAILLKTEDILFLRGGAKINHVKVYLLLLDRYDRAWSISQAILYFPYSDILASISNQMCRSST